MMILLFFKVRINRVYEHLHLIETWQIASEKLFELSYTSLFTADVSDSFGFKLEFSVVYSLHSKTMSRPTPGSLCRTRGFTVELSEQYHVHMCNR